MKSVLVACLLCLLPSCLGFSWERERRFRPLGEAELERLEAGTTMERCLAVLGAPLYVWEYRETGVALAWGAIEDRNLGFSASIAVSRDFSASVNYDHINEGFKGVVLVFGEDRRLKWIRRGYLNQIAAETHRSSALIED